LVPGLHRPPRCGTGRPGASRSTARRLWAGGGPDDPATAFGCQYIARRPVPSRRSVMIAAGPRKKTLAHSTLAGVTYQYAATAANGVVQVGVIAVLARLIAPVEFGQVGLATAYIGFWALFAAFGVGSAVVQRPELTERMLRAGFTLSL